MAIRIDLERLISDDLDTIRTGIEDSLRKAPDFRKADLVLTPRVDLDTARFAELWQRVGELLCSDTATLPIGYPDGEWSADLRDRIRTSVRPLIFTLGVVSGDGLQRGLSGLQNARTGPVGYRDTWAFVVHARPVHERDWELLLNAFGRKYLLAAWRTLVPERCPLVEEHELLSALDSEDVPSLARTFLNGRRDSITNGRTHIDAVFWGQSVDARISPNSIFGERLSAIAVFSAVGSALQHTRSPGPELVPDWLQFDVQKIAKSYYDPLILISMFRWLESREMWWGTNPADAELILHAIVDRTRGSNEVRNMLIPELLLAAAQHKIPPTAHQFLLDLSRDLDTPETHLGRFLVNRLRPANKL
jgi:hypothetical protein